MRRRRYIRLTFLAFGLVAVGGCGGGENVALKARVEELERQAASTVTSETTSSTSQPTTSSTSTTTAAAALPTTTIDPLGPDRSVEALAFFKGTKEACSLSGGLDEKRFTEARVTSRRTGDRYVIRDGAGTVLVVDLQGRIVTGLDGATGLMPRPYSFDCPPALYPGANED